MGQYFVTIVSFRIYIISNFVDICRKSRKTVLKHPFHIIIGIVQSTHCSSNIELPCVGYGLTPKLQLLGLCVPLSDLSTLGEYSLSSGSMELRPGYHYFGINFPMPPSVENKITGIYEGNKKII